tara:strand:+ start:1183 stop:2262 length:1080 start_codon:yes stop_codon:yes gene_type:complete
MDVSKKVWSCNEWDPLEEVIVGTVKNAVVPEWNVALGSATPSHSKWFFDEYGGKPFPREMTDAAEEELNNLVTVLEKLDITVKRPAPLDFSDTYKTPWWSSTGLYAAMPRDVLLIVGDIIVEAPMAWRTRYFEIFAFRDLIEEYFKDGARWLPAPKSTMNDAFYNQDFDPENAEPDGIRQFAISEKEVAFDAADFVRFGTDIFVQKSEVTNEMGIEWVRRHIGSEYTIHELSFDEEHPLHIDTSIVPIAPGKLLINPSWVRKDHLPDMFDSWEIIEAPAPTKPFDSALYFSSDWLTINFLSIDSKRAIVEENETPLMELLYKHGIEPIPVPFRNFYPFGGSIHCATTDVRRRGKLESYF